ncbi:GIY-YIG nuclease family protein [Undibacterium flavidum]|uniref:GIY-YIG nuclease family protein n=1 Tax=Undibacterium flavidum TaxID=2762297 RepID=A0ABR6Y9K4_9BURK|nr:GIY-YIG nuclease family protein [Undibacterium flavidum]MBC3873312.1 GIY-YIG nuclease family protein [Undibacterium flavidum]
MSQPFSLKIFVATGDPDGLRIVERSNWIGKAIVFPRPLLPTIKQREEFAQTGVYLLLGPRPDGDGEMIYIGEGDPVRPRMENHFSNKDFWTRAVFFVAGSGQLNKAHVQFLESQLIQRAKDAKRMRLENIKSETEPTLSEADRADMLVFLDHMLSMLPVLGISAFEMTRATDIRVADITLLNCVGKGLKAQGYESNQGFVVKANSQASVELTASMQQQMHGIVDLRQDLIANEVLQRVGDCYVFKQDYSFSSPSTAAAIILGRSANGRTEWKDETGRTLKEIQTQQAGL